MNSRLPFLAAVLSLFFSVPAGAETTTTVKFCDDSSDDSNYTDNRYASGWNFSDIGANDTKSAGTYSHPVKFKGSTGAQSASTPSGSYLTQIVLGVWIGNTARTVTVTPLLESGSPGTAQTAAPSSTSGLIEMPFSFSLANCVTGVTVSIAASGNSTAYLYYATVTTETPSGGGGNTAPVATQASVGVNATVGTAATLDLSDYFYDADGDTLTYALDSGVGNVTGSIWSFTPNAAGSFSAVVSAADPSGTSATMAISVVATLEGGLLIATLLDENFSNATTGWGSSSYFHSKVADAGTWTDLEGCTNLANARSAIVIGRASVDGCALSPEITLTNATSGTVTIAFDTASFYGKSASGSLSIADPGSGDVIFVVTNFTPPAIAADNTAAANVASVAETGIRIVAKDVAVSSPFRLRFDSTRGTGDNYNRIYLDSIKVTQVYDPNYRVLTAPTGLDTNVVDKAWFSVSWNTVTNATGYEVEVFDESSVPAGTAVVSGTNATVSGLSDGATYSVQVRALGDGLHYGDSQPSAAISVTTLADAQKIDFAVAGAPAGDVYAGDTISFTVTATNESTHAAEPVSFAGGLAGATFDSATGAFSWTPAESDVGNRVASFTSGAYFTNVTIKVVSAFATRVLFHESFAGCDTKWGNSADMPENGTTAGGKRYADEDGWTFSDCYRGMSGLKMGTENKHGDATTRPIVPVTTATNVQLSFRAAAYTNKTGSLTVAAAGGASFSETVSLAAITNLSAAIPETAGYSFGPYDVAASGDFALSFAPASGDGRMGVDEILVVQTVSAKIRDLAAPNGLAVAEGSVSTNGFTVGWNEVGNATNYAVRVTDATGAVVFSAPFCAEPPVAVEGLLDDEDYAVQVRATGDETLFFASPWSDALSVRTERSPLHPTLSFDGWWNAVGTGGLYAGVTNAAAVSAVRGNGSNAVVTLKSVSPAPVVRPKFANGILSWTPSDSDTNRTFAVSFLMDGVYTTNIFCEVHPVPPLRAPDVTVGEVAWNAIPLSWDSQHRAASYGVRAWFGCPNPGATPTRVEEPFAFFHEGIRPGGWTFECASRTNAVTPVAFTDDGKWIATYDLGGTVESVSFVGDYASGGNKASVLRLYGTAGGTNREDWVELANWTAGGIKGEHTTEASAGLGIRRLVWAYSKDGGNAYVGDVAIEGTGFTTPRWLTGWGPAPKNVGSATSCTVTDPRPGRLLGVNPENKAEDLFEPQTNYVEVSAFDAAGASRSTIVEVGVPGPPRNVRATLLIVK